VALGDDIKAEIAAILRQPWAARDGKVVPTSESVSLNGGRVDLKATLFYADLADSTRIAVANREAAARLFRAYLSLTARIIRANVGEIRSFDGDRIMAVFLGDTPNTNAVKAGLQVHWAFDNLLKPRFEAQYALFTTGGYRLAQAVGIDHSDMSVVRGGIRDNNDLVWVGRAPNVAAKLSSLREGAYATYITDTVYAAMADPAKLGGNPARNMWEERTWASVPVAKIYRSNWWWAI
jgi:class 3 adenylate cyclase